MMTGPSAHPEILPTCSCQIGQDRLRKETLSLQLDNRQPLDTCLGGVRLRSCLEWLVLQRAIEEDLHLMKLPGQVPAWMARGNALPHKPQRSDDDACADLLAHLPGEGLVQIFSVLLSAPGKYEPIPLRIAVANDEISVSSAEDGTR